MGQLRFNDTATLRRIADACIACGTSNVPYSERQEPFPAFWLVKDHGVYIMAARPAELGDEGGKTVTTFAAGMNPNVDDFDDWYDAARDACGGDDFVESIEVTPELRRGLETARALIVNLTADSMVVELEMPR